MAGKDYVYDIALSFAEEDRAIAHLLKNVLGQVGLGKVYFYPDHPERGWGKDLAKHLAKIYEQDARYGIVLLSKHYFGKKYTEIEYAAMLRRALDEEPDVYMLPVVIGDVKKLNKPELEKLHFITWDNNPDYIAATARNLLGKNTVAIATEAVYKPYRRYFANNNYAVVMQRLKRIIIRPPWGLIIAGCTAVMLAIYGISTICLSYPSKKIQLPAGTYTMGSRGIQKDMLPYTVVLKPFAIWSTEITFREYWQYCDSNKLEKPPLPPYAYTEDCPIVNITWKEAAAYCAWRGGRLPTEAEWEYAAAQNGKSTDRYSGSNNISRVGYYETNAGGKAHPVAKKCGGQLGLHDMSGNVAEWCADWYAPYADSLQHNPLAADSSSQRKVVRGGHYGSHVKPNATDNQLRITFRDSERPDSARPYIGFRVVWDE